MEVRIVNILLYGVLRMKLKYVMSIWLLMEIGISCAGIAIKTVSIEDLHQKWNDVDKNSIENIEEFEKTYLAKSQREYYINERMDGRSLLEKIDKEIVLSKDKIYFSKAESTDYENIRNLSHFFQSEEYKQKFQSLIADRNRENLETYFTKKYPNIKRENIFFWNDQGCSKNPNGDECKAIHEFHYAHLNDSENKDLLNSWNFEGDEFELKKKKTEWNELRKKRYIIIRSENSNHLKLNDYDFKKKQIPIMLMIQGSAGSVFGIGGIEYNILETNKYFYPIKEDDAKDFKAKQNKEWIALLDMKTVVKQIKNYDCREPGTFAVRLSEEGFERVKDSYYAYYCKPRSDSFKIYQGSIIAIDFND